MTNGKRLAVVDKLLEFPVLADTISYIGNTKYGITAFNLTSSAVNTVSNVTKPVSEQFQDQIAMADKVAAESVAYIGEKFPIVRRPTSEVLGKVKTPITTVRQYQETFGNTFDNKFTTPTKIIFNQRVAVPSLNMAKAVDSSLTIVVDKLEVAVYTWLPEEDSNSNERDINNSVPSSDTFQTFRALNLADVGRQRLTKRFKTKLHNTTSTYNFAQLQESNVLLKQATDTVASLNQILTGMVVNVRDSVQNPENSFNIQSRLHDLTTLLLGDLNNKEDLQKTVSTRIIDLSQALVATTDSISAYIKQNAKNFPEALQFRLHPLVNFFEERYADIVKEIKNGEGTPTEKARNIVNVTTQHTLPLLQSSLTDFQELLQFYKTSLETSVNNTAEKVKTTVGKSAQMLGVN
ncbi:7544_t:CDS:2 [Diversispora eburnea]|uniref:7544_t:CDS:1 n=1 Tax=Diversispora eburnea TaxID=1213867 RepID=A0A9N8VEW2_9GLOM|nr:7544_t:CDS:2 [Diversispora eburnea]